MEVDDADKFAAEVADAYAILSGSGVHEPLGIIGYPRQYHGGPWRGQHQHDGDCLPLNEYSIVTIPSNPEAVLSMMTDPETPEARAERLARVKKAIEQVVQPPAGKLEAELSGRQIRFED